MDTICPYPDCRFSYEIAADSFVRQAQCPSCLRFGSRKPLTSWQEMERLSAKRSGIGEHLYPVNSHVIAGVLDDIRSLWNVGSIFRSADAAGISTLYLCGLTGCPPRSEIAKTSLGAEESINWHYVIHPLDVIEQLKQSGAVIVGLERTTTSVEIKDFVTQPDDRIVLIVGNEVNGISEEVLANCNHILHLPMKGVKESLNVAVAFGVAAYALTGGV